jgi:hypothetical protein
LSSPLSDEFLDYLVLVKMAGFNSSLN